jgi:hypothetical protein
MDVTYVLNFSTIGILMSLSYDVLETNALFLLCLPSLSIFGVLSVRKSDGGNQLHADQITQSQCEGTTPKI